MPRPLTTANCPISRMSSALRLSIRHSFDGWWILWRSITAQRAQTSFAPPSQPVMHGPNVLARRTCPRRGRSWESLPPKIRTFPLGATMSSANPLSIPSARAPRHAQRGSQFQANRWQPCSLRSAFRSRAMVAVFSSLCRTHAHRRALRALFASSFLPVSSLFSGLASVPSPAIAATWISCTARGA